MNAIHPAAYGNPRSEPADGRSSDSYAPVTVLVDERADGVHVSYDRMASFLAVYGNSETLAVARSTRKWKTSCQTRQGQ
jgi:hypothetical protein